jgi:hypothetical protein
MGDVGVNGGGQRVTVIGPPSLVGLCTLGGIRTPYLLIRRDTYSHDPEVPTTEVLHEPSTIAPLQLVVPERSKPKIASTKQIGHMAGQFCLV